MNCVNKAREICENRGSWFEIKEVKNNGEWMISDIKIIGRTVHKAHGKLYQIIKDSIEKQIICK